MKALVYLGNETVELREIERPPRAENEVVIRVGHAGICGTDLHIFLGDMPQRVTPPHVMGHEMCGEVVEATPSADISVGDRVIVEPTVFCDRCPACRRGHRHVCQNLNFMGCDSPGAFQEYWNVPADRLHKVPDALSDEEGAMIEPLTVAIHDVRRVGVTLGDRAVVIGGGPIGLLVAVIARLDGAEVILSEVNPFRVKQGEAFGFHAVNPLEEDISQVVEDWTGGAGADLVFEVSGSAEGARVMTELVRVRGTIGLVGVHATPRPVDLHQFFLRELSLVACRVYEPVDFDRAIRIAASGQIDLAGMISKVIPLADAQWGFEQMKRGGDVMKLLLNCRA